MKCLILFLPKTIFAYLSSLLVVQLTINKEELEVRSVVCRPLDREADKVTPIDSPSLAVYVDSYGHLVTGCVNRSSDFPR